MDKVNGQCVNAILIMKNKNKTLTVNVSVEPFEETLKEVRITTKDILQHLSEKQLKVGTCLKSSVVSNKNSNSLFGTWEFEYSLKTKEKEVLLENISSQNDTE